MPTFILYLIVKPIGMISMLKIRYFQWFSCQLLFSVFLIQKTEGRKAPEISRMTRHFLFIYETPSYF